LKKKIKTLCLVIASRANYGRVKSIIYELRKNKKFKLKIILAASALLHRFGSLKKILKKDGVKYHKESHFIVEGESPLTMAKSTGLALIELCSAFNDLKPDVVITVGDRYETIATAIAASYMNITLAHIQGGEITGSIDESVRHAITKLSHIHFAATNNSKKNIIKLGEDKKFVFNVGCPSLDLINKDIAKYKNSYLSINTGLGPKIDFKKKYLLIIFHPVTTEYGLSFKQTQEIIDSIQNITHQVIWLWPNIDAGSDGISKCIRENREAGRLNHVTFYKNLPVDQYNYVLSNALCCVGNSSSFIREGSFLGTPCVLIGERQNKREIGNNIIKSRINKKEILKKIKIQIRNKKIKKSYIYGNGLAAKQISNLLYNLNPSVQKTLNY
jgi:UDP-hydrolysing UDP-N-acetyl-D-glucosamine 2-epimerase